MGKRSLGDRISSSAPDDPKRDEEGAMSMDDFLMIVIVLAVIFIAIDTAKQD